MSEGPVYQAGTMAALQKGILDGDETLRVGGRAAFDYSGELDLKLPGNKEFNKASFN